MHWSKTWRSTLVVVAAGLVVACGYRPAYKEEPENQSEIELQPALPTYPIASNLKRIDLGPDEPFEYSVDTGSVSLAAGPVLLYTLVVRSPAGAMNVSYEGMRCRSLERRIYASGRPDGTWAISRSATWLPITRQQKGYFALADSYFCPARRPVLTAAEAVSALRAGGHPDAALR